MASAFNEDLKDNPKWTKLHVLGSGSNGVVRALRNNVTGQYVAEKRMTLSPLRSNYRKETQVMQGVSNIHLVKYLG